MISVDSALKIILKNIKTKNSYEYVKIQESLNRITFENIISRYNIPSFNNSAMDGYTVKSKDIKKASIKNPITLKIIKKLSAGQVSNLAISKGQAIKIMTGTLIPKGADSVIMVEDTRSIKNNSVSIFKGTKPFENIRQIGNNIKKGEIVIKKGTVLKPAHIGILASIGVDKVKILKKPKISFFVSGDEVKNIKDKLKFGQIRNSNSYVIEAQIKETGALPINHGIVKDELDKIRKKIIKSLKNCDILITCGGISMGEFDLIKKALKTLGAKILFWKISMRPGKPNLFAILNGIPVFCLPGNPVSSMVSFEILVKPAIYKMTGRHHENNEATGILTENFYQNDLRRHYVRAITEWKNNKYCVKITGKQDSNILKSMAMANSLIVVDDNTTMIKKGQEVKIILLR